MFLGTACDTENDGAPSAAADGDGSDEDGFTAPNTAFAVGGYFIQGVSDSQNRITLVASGAGFVNAWIDFDGNGTFDAGEQVFTNQTLVAGVNLLSFAVPLSATTGDTYARFRLSSEGGLGPTGAAADGEVEDYLVPILDAGSISGTVYTDVDRDGVLDAGEVGIPQVTLSLRDTQGNILAFAQTAPDGSYLFNLTALGLPAGNYTVVEIQPTGYGLAGPGNLTGVVDVDLSGTRSAGDLSVGTRTQNQRSAHGPHRRRWPLGLRSDASERLRAGTGHAAARFLRRPGPRRRGRAVADQRPLRE